MRTHYLITHPKRGTWGRGEELAEAIERCAFTGSQDEVHVYLVDPEATVNAGGNPQGTFVAFLGIGRVMADKLQVAMTLGGPTALVSSRDTLTVDRIHRTLEESEAWSDDTVAEIADILRHAGFAVHDPEGLEEEG